MLSPSKPKPKRIKSGELSGGQLIQLIPNPVPKVAKFPAGRDSALLSVRSQGVYLQL